MWNLCHRNLYQTTINNTIYVCICHLGAIRRVTKNHIERKIKSNTVKRKERSDRNNLRNPDELALEIVENLEAGLLSFKEIISVLEEA